MRIDSLVIEVTRKCNAKCKHCLRGPAQNINIETEYIDKLLDEVNEIGTITFSGGEPSLNIEAIRHTFNEIVKRDIYVGSVFIATNAMKYSLGLVRVMNDWFQYCFNNYSLNSIDSKDIAELKKQYEIYGEIYNQEIIDYLQESSFGLSISFDDFHPGADNKALRIYKSLPYYSPSKDQRGNKSFNNYLINEGNAKKNKIGNNFKKLSYEFYLDEDQVDMVYLNVNGDVLPDCDFSYTSQSKFKNKNNIMKFSLTEITQTRNIEVA